MGSNAYKSITARKSPNYILVPIKDLIPRRRNSSREILPAKYTGKIVIIFRISPRKSSRGFRLDSTTAFLGEMRKISCEMN